MMLVTCDKVHYNFHITLVAFCIMITPLTKYVTAQSSFENESLVKFLNLHTLLLYDS